MALNFFGRNKPSRPVPPNDPNQPTYGGFPGPGGSYDGFPGLPGSFPPTYGGFPGPGVSYGGFPSHSGVMAANDTMAPSGNSSTPTVITPMTSQGAGDRTMQEFAVNNNESLQPSMGPAPAPAPTVVTQNQAPSAAETQRDVNSGQTTTIAANLDAQGTLKDAHYLGIANHDPYTGDKVHPVVPPPSAAETQRDVNSGQTTVIEAGIDSSGKLINPHYGSVADHNPYTSAAPTTSGNSNSFDTSRAEEATLLASSSPKAAPIAAESALDARSMALNKEYQLGNGAGTHAPDSTANAALDARSTALNKEYGLGESTPAAPAAHSTAPTSATVGFTDTTSSAQAARPAQAYTGGATPVKVQVLKNGATLTTTSRGAEIEQMPGHTAYQVKAAAVSDAHPDPAIQVAVSNAASPPDAVDRYMTSHTVAAAPTTAPSPPIQTGPAFTTPPAQHFGDVSAGGGLSALDPGTNVHHMGRSSIIEL